MRIAVFRALQLGDMLCAVPTLRALRAAYPDAEVTLVGLPWAHAFCERFAHLVDAFVEFPGFPGLPEQPARLGEFPRFVSTAQSAEFDLAVQLHGSGEITNPLVLALAARETAGFHPPGGWCPDSERFLPWPATGSEVRRLLALADHLGWPRRGDALEFPLEPEDFERLPLPNGDYVCIHPGARLEVRRWPADEFASVADALAGRGLEVVLTGSEAEADLVAAVEDAMRAPATNVVGRTTLGGLAALVSRARLVVCNDTGISHVAAAVRAPSVVVVTTSDPDRWAPLDRELHRVVVRPDGVSDVLEAADAQLERYSNPSRWTTA